MSSGVTVVPQSAVAETGEPSHDASGAMSPWEYICLITVLVTFAAQALMASPSKSASFDEQYHLAAGYAYLRTGDYRLATTHPPLMGLISGMALLARTDVVLPLDHPSWAAGDRFLFSDVFLWEANTDSPALGRSGAAPDGSGGIITGRDALHVVATHVGSICGVDGNLGGCV